MTSCSATLGLFKNPAQLAEEVFGFFNMRCVDNHQGMAIPQSAGLRQAASRNRATGDVPRRRFH